MHVLNFGIDEKGLCFYIFELRRSSSSADIDECGKRRKRTREKEEEEGKRGENGKEKVKSKIRADKKNIGGKGG